MIETHSWNISVSLHLDSDDINNDVTIVASIDLQAGSVQSCVV